MEKDFPLWLIAASLLVVLLLVSACTGNVQLLQKDTVLVAECPPRSGGEWALATPVGPIGVYYKRCVLNSPPAFPSVAVVQPYRDPIRRGALVTSKVYR